jgi:hypothetical protein
MNRSGSQVATLGNHVARTDDGPVCVRSALRKFLFRRHPPGLCWPCPAETEIQMRTNAIVMMMCLLASAGCLEPSAAPAVQERVQTQEAPPPAPSLEGPIEGPIRRMVIGAPLANAASPLTTGGPDFYGQLWIWPDYGTYLFYPVMLPVGCTLISASVRLQKFSGRQTSFWMDVQKVHDGNSIALTWPVEQNPPGTTTLKTSAQVAIEPDLEYSIRLGRGGGPANVDRSMWAAIEYSCPP